MNYENRAKQCIVGGGDLAANMEQIVTAKIFDVVKDADEEVLKLVKLLQRVNTFMDDVMPQIGGLFIQDYGNLNWLTIELGIFNTFYLDIENTIHNGELKKSEFSLSDGTKGTVDWSKTDDEK